jgi:hypothetical protein
MSKIDIEPTTQILYWNKEDKKTWTPRLTRIRKTYAQAEIDTVLNGMRRVYVYHINSERFEDSYKFLKDNGLVFFPTNKSGVYQGFSNKHRPVVKGQPYTLYGGAVKADDLEAGKLFEEYSLNRPVNHAGIGKELLGYMDCCIDFFKANWNITSIDPMYEAAIVTDGAKIKDRVATVKTHPYCNNMLRYFGIRITPHLTCSLNCKKTIKWGKKWFKVMSEIDEEAANWTKELLSMPLTWSCYKGVVIIDTPIFRGVSNSDGVLEKKTVNNLGWT